MKKIVLLFSFVSCSIAGVAQNTVYDYAILEYSPFARRIEIEMFPAAKESILLKDVAGKENDRDRAFFIAKIQELEGQGWEVIGTQLATPGEMSSSIYYHWVMRKRKQ